MNRTQLFTVVCSAMALAACESGDINIQPSTSVGDTIINGGGGGTDPNEGCASYVNEAGQTISGVADGNGNCTYGSAFVGPKNELTTDLLIPALPDGGAHIFSSAIIVGKNLPHDPGSQRCRHLRGRRRPDADDRAWRDDCTVFC